MSGDVRAKEPVIFDYRVLRVTCLPRCGSDATTRQKQRPEPSDSHQAIIPAAFGELLSTEAAFVHLLAGAVAVSFQMPMVALQEGRLD